MNLNVPDFKTCLSRFFFVLAVACMITATGCKQTKEAIKIRSKRVVAADVAEWEKLRSHLGTPVSGSLASIGADMGSMLGVSEIAVVTTRDDPAGEFVIMNVSFSEAFLRGNNSSVGSRDTFSSGDFRVFAGSEFIYPLIITPGTYTKSGSDEVCGFQNFEIVKTGKGDAAKYVVRSRGKADDSEEKGGPRPSATPQQDLNPPEVFHRDPLETRVNAIKPTTLKENVWASRLQMSMDTGWNASEVTLLFRLPKDRANAKFVAFNDMEKAVPLNLK